MTEYFIDLTQVESAEEFHKTIAGAMEFPEYYGNNLDALWDVLMEISQETEITFRGFEEFANNNPEFGETLENLLTDLTVENENVSICFEEIEQYTLEELENMDL